ncbi:MAG: hypothetical protein R3D33_13235 [Hyphomicrobiaceae bacterium]
MWNDHEAVADGSTARVLVNLLALAVFLVLAVPAVRHAPLVTLSVRPETTVREGHGTSDGESDLARRREHLIGVYGGMPYTQSSDVHVTRPDGSQFDMKGVNWDGKPFQEPIYYGVRILSWGREGRLGGMIDFTHAKAIHQTSQEVALQGTKDGTALPPKAAVGTLFKRLEFSHGHNMLTLNGLYRLPIGTATVRPYVGIGAGIALPHTEIWVEGDPRRTYEYQYAGPVVQALIGAEIRLPRSLSLFIEYKFDYSWYDVPLTGDEGSWLGLDLSRQMKRWLNGEAAPNGRLSTDLATHQLIGGVLYSSRGR